jgi:uncharacterized protein YjbJ (UPF0337 family)
MNRNYETDVASGTDPNAARNPPSAGTAHSTAPADGQVNHIRESIEQTRADMSETIDELQGRLSPAHLKEQVKEQVIEHYNQVKGSIRAATIGRVDDMVERVSDRVYETRRGVVNTVTANPVPAALIGIGLAWLWINRGDAGRSGREREGDSARRYGGTRGSYMDGAPYSRHQLDDEERGPGKDLQRTWVNSAGTAMGGVADQVKSTAGDLAGKAKDTASGAVDQVQQVAGRVADLAHDRAHRVEQHFDTAMRDGPLAVGAIALAIGTAVGLALPRTRAENEWMGEARDTFVDKAQSVAGEAIENVTQKVTAEISSPASVGRQETHAARST